VAWPGRAAGSAEVASMSANRPRVNSTDQRADTGTPAHRPKRMPLTALPPGRCAATRSALIGSFVSGLITALLISHLQSRISNGLARS
jgi:hypothetical protein